MLLLSIHYYRMMTQLTTIYLFIIIIYIIIIIYTLLQSDGDTVNHNLCMLLFIINIYTLL